MPASVSDNRYGKHGPTLDADHNIPENYFKVILVNPRHIKNLPGRKTDISDGEGFSPIPRWGH